MERGNGGVGVGVGVSVGVGFGGVYNVNDYSAGESPTKPIPLVAPSLAAVQIVRGIGVPKGPTEKAREAKRARRSEIERMSRQRRSGQYGSMREEVARLERQQANMIFRYESGATAPASGGVAARREQYLRAVTEVRKLREEQSRLRDMIHEHALLAISFHEMSEAFLEEDMVTWESALTTWVDALTMDDAVAVMRESCRIAATFEGGGPWQSTGGQFMGWRDKRKLIESTSTMIHRFTKVFPGHRAQDLMETSWNKFCDEAFCQKTIVNASTSLQIHLLQELNDSIRVTRRRTQYEGLPHKSFHTVYVMFRIQTDDGFVICLKSIDAPEVQRSLGDHESWVDVFHWITFTNLTDENGDDDASGCEVTFGGTLQSGVRKFALHWLIESALAVVRWETACVAPHFILPGE